MMIGYMMKPTAEVLAENIVRLKQWQRMRSDDALAKKAHVDQKTIWRIRNRQQSPTVDMLESIANVFGLHAWHLLIQNIDPENPPVCAMSRAERDLYRKLRALRIEELPDPTYINEAEE